MAEEVDVRKLDMNERQQIVDKIYKVSEEDNEKYLIKFRNRLEKSANAYVEAHAPFPYSEPFFGGSLVAYGPQAVGCCGGMHILDLVTRVWVSPECKGTPPSPRESHTVVLVGGYRLVIFGGSGEGRANYLNDLHILELGTMRWTSPELKGEFPVLRDNHSTIAIGNKLIVYGGDSGYQYHGNIDILDMETMTWSKLRIQGSSPGVWAGHAAVNIGTKVYIIRGVGEKRYYNDIWIFDICTCSWTQLYITGQLHGLSTYITTWYAPPNPHSNRHTATSSVQIIDCHLDMKSFLFLAVLLYEVNKISGSVLSVQTSDSRSKKYSGRALCRHGIVAFRVDTRLRKGGPISAGLLEAIEGSQITDNLEQRFYKNLRNENLALMASNNPYIVVLVYSNLRMRNGNNGVTFECEDPILFRTQRVETLSNLKSLILSKLGGTQTRKIERVTYRLLAPMGNEIFRF
ncbi:uncharacterized protein LOC130975634 [Arachis stenosperma]|uniref:uncharacterized protein LOC130975634 n=1 Tax=Arachis stenosperma TaxID=217475 RepID=UPI0025AC01B4|nr:uncharacterized protein LOC130975634 [Arachis stenosperma]